MAKKLPVTTIALAVVGGFAVLVAVDHFVLKGKLGISGKINQMIGQIKKSFGQGAGPITAPGPSEVMPSTEELTGVLEGLPGGEEEVMPPVEEAMRARLRRARMARRRVRLGGYGI